MLRRDLLERIDAEIAPFLDAAATGRDDFVGRQTVRVGALIARSPSCRDVVMHAQILDAANTFLKPYCNRILLHLTQLIRILPGQGAQPLHRDRLGFGGFLPETIEPQFNTLGR